MLQSYGSNTVIERKFIQFVNKKNLKQNNYIQNNNGKFLDLVFSSLDLDITIVPVADEEVIGRNTSHHTALSMDFPCNFEISNKTSQQFMEIENAKLNASNSITRRQSL